MCKLRPQDVSRWQWDGRLWHARIEGQYETACGKRLKGVSRSLKFFHPPDDTACAKCCRIIWGNGMGRPEAPHLELVMGQALGASLQEDQDD